MTAIGAHPGSRRAIRQTFWITVGALVLYLGVRSLPMGRGDLHYTDFAAGSSGGLEFCAPGGPQFVPVDRVASPVTMDVRAVGGSPLAAGSGGSLVVRLTTPSGKPVTEDDLLVVHTRKLHLLAVDPALLDYQHLHPIATATPGEYQVDFAPARTGEYRFFADFTPRATGRALYAGARVRVTEGGARPPAEPHATSAEATAHPRFLDQPESILLPAAQVAGAGLSPGSPPIVHDNTPPDASGTLATEKAAAIDDRPLDASRSSAAGQAAAIDETLTSVVDGYRFALSLTPAVFRINETAELGLDVRSPDGTPAQLDEIMGARAHVVAFDLGRTGFAHLHPLGDAANVPGADAPLRFELNLPDPGVYRLWAQVKIGGREYFAPFTLLARP